MRMIRTNENSFWTRTSKKLVVVANLVNITISASRRSICVYTKDKNGFKDNFAA